MAAEAPGLIPITFEPVPEITPDDISAVFADIFERHLEGLPTYGAHVLRNCDAATLSRITLEANRFYPVEKFKYNSITLADTVQQSFFTGLHYDFGLQENEISCHEMTDGMAEFAILCGAAQRPDTLNVMGAINFGLTERLGKMVLDEHAYDEPMDRALYTAVRKGDVILFDHAQMHVFRSLAQPRRSNSRFYLPIVGDDEEAPWITAMWNNLSAVPAE